ncbi:MAG TPA: hypothetical protein VJ793_13330 [Anaerolineae bacterium]|nr:hypothetical protein [Anaerolineae bacterium]
MTSATRQMVIVKAGGVIEIRDPQLPAGAVVEVIVLVDVPLAPKTGRPEDRGWPDGFFEEVAGGWQGAQLVREDQGEYEIREELE